MTKSKDLMYTHTHSHTHTHTHTYMDCLKESRSVSTHEVRVVHLTI